MSDREPSAGASGVREGRIPKRLFHFWHDERTMPEHIRRAIESKVAMHPGFEHRLADDAFVREVIGRRYGQRALELYVDDTIPASRSDLARLVLLIEYGGLYIDTALELHEPLDSVIRPDKTLVLSRWYGLCSNGMLGAVPGHPFLVRVLEQALRNLERGYFNHHVSAATGPLCLQAALDHHGVPEGTQWVPLSRIAFKGEQASRYPAGTAGSWQGAQHQGIVRRGRRATAPTPEAEGGREPFASRQREEAEYLAAVPAELSSMDFLPDTVRHALNESLTGNPSASWLDDLARRGPFRRVALLTLGATPTDGAFFRAVQAEGVTIYSPKAGLLAKLRRPLERTEPTLVVDTVAASFDELCLPENTYDLVLSQYCLHRVSSLDAMFDMIARSLTPEGMLAFLEYVGEDRFQFSSRRLELASELLDVVFPGSGRDSTNPVTSPSPEEFGPLAAVHSSRIVPTARTRLEERHHAACVVALAPLVLMAHPSLGELAWTRPRHLEGSLQALVDHERELLRRGETGTLAYGVYGRRRTGDDPRRGAEGA